VKEGKRVITGKQTSCSLVLLSNKREKKGKKRKGKKRKSGWSIPALRVFPTLPIDSKKRKEGRKTRMRKKKRGKPPGLLPYHQDNYLEPTCKREERKPEGEKERNDYSKNRPASPTGSPGRKKKKEG